MSRVNVVPKSRKSVTCSKCGTVVPVGSSYRWIKPRYSSKLIRCMAEDCCFRPTDLSSAKVAAIYEAIEDAEATISLATCLDDIQMALGDVVSIAQDTASEYQGASDNWAGGNGNEEFQDKAETCENFANELESWEPSGETDEEEVRSQARDQGHDPDDDWEEALEAMRSEAIDKLGEFEI